MKEFLNHFTSFLSIARGLDADARTIADEQYAWRARERAMLIERIHLDRAATGDLGDAALGTLDDANDAGMLNPAGLFLGALDGWLLYHNGDGHHLVYARAGGGKGVSSAQPNLAHVKDSLFVIDVKDGELHFSSAEHRAKTLKHRVVTLDPWGIRGDKPIRANPLHRLGELARRGRIDDEADEIALILLPKGKADSGESAWAVKGARRMLTMRMKYLAYCEPDKLTLSNLWRFFNCADEELIAAFDAMIDCGHEDVAGPAAANKSVFLEASKQFEATRSECIDVLNAFTPGSVLASATDGNDIEFGEMKHRHMTVYLCVPSAKLGVAAPWIAITLNHGIEQIAAETGPDKVRFLIDEIAQLPAPIPAVMKALRLYRGRGILLSMYCQGRFSLQDAGYKEAAIKEIEDQSSCIQMWGGGRPLTFKRYRILVRKHVYRSAKSEPYGRLHCSSLAWEV